MSPELLAPDMFGLKKSRPTRESDCYALGMTIYEVLSGQVPFALLKGSIVVRKVPYGERPERPQRDDGKYFTDGVWGVVQRCWEHQPRDRIRAEAILMGLEGNSTPLELPSNVSGDVEMDGDVETDEDVGTDEDVEMDEDVETDGDDQLDITASDSGKYSSGHPQVHL